MTSYIIGILAGIIGFLYFDRWRLSSSTTKTESTKELNETSDKIEKNKISIKEEEKKLEEFKPQKKSIDELLTYFNDKHK